MWATRDGQIIYVNERLCTLVGFSREELYKMTINDLHSGIYEYRKRFDILKQAGGRAILETNYLCKNGQLLPVEISGNYVIVDNVELNCCIVRDVTERRTVEAQLKGNISALERQEERIRQLTKACINAQEKERQLVSIELHDRIIQGLVSILHQLDTLGQLDDREANTIKRAKDYVNELISESRRLMAVLFPSTLLRYGLVNLLEQELSELEDQIKANCQLKSNLRCRLDHETETTLYRIAHESLLNIKMHGKDIHNVTVCIVESVSKVHLTISDDGYGFDVEYATKNISHRGIEGMLRRAELLDGCCTVTSQIGEGTTVNAWLPVQPIEQISE